MIARYRNNNSKIAAPSCQYAQCKRVCVCVCVRVNVRVHVWVCVCACVCLVRSCRHENTTRGLQTDHSVSRLGSVRQLRSGHTPTSTRCASTARYTQINTYDPKPGQISTQACGGERWRLWGRDYVTQQTVFSSSSSSVFPTSSKDLSVVLPPTGQFMYHISKRWDMKDVWKRQTLPFHKPLIITIFH